MDRYAFYSSVERYKDANPEEHEKDAIKHYGIMGQKWGQRRWQNPDGTFNQAGKERYFGSGKNEKNPDGVIGNSSNKKNPSGNMEGSVADYFHKNVYLKTDKNTLKKIKKYPDIYDTEGLTDKEILQAIRRVPKIPYSAEYGRLVREELYRTQMNKKRAKYYDDNSKDVSEEENADMSDYETEKMMNHDGWESKSVPKYNEYRKEKKIVYSKDIDNDEYEGKKFTIEHDDLSDYGVSNAINDGNKALNFLNKKGSYQKILNEIADNQYDLYVDVMKDNGKKPVSKSEFIKNEGLKISEIGLDTYSNSFNKGKIVIEFDPKPHSDWFGYEFDVWIDPDTGKYIELYQS